MPASSADPPLRIRRLRASYGGPEEPSYRTGWADGVEGTGWGGVRRVRKRGKGTERGKDEVRNWDLESAAQYGGLEMHRDFLNATSTTASSSFTWAGTLAAFATEHPVRAGVLKSYFSMKGVEARSLAVKLVVVQSREEAAHHGPLFADSGM